MLAALTTIAQDLTNYTYTSPATKAAEGGSNPLLSFIYFVLTVLTVVAVWKVFRKANRPGWAAIVPVYNQLQTLWMVGRPWWWILLLCIPLVNLVVAAIIMNDIAKSFGKGTGMTLLLFFLPFVGFPILGFGSATYHGPSAGQSGSGAATPTATPPADSAVPKPPTAPAV